MQGSDCRSVASHSVIWTAIKRSYLGRAVADFPAAFFIFVTLIFVMKHNWLPFRVLLQLDQLTHMSQVTCSIFYQEHNQDSRKCRSLQLNLFSSWSRATKIRRLEKLMMENMTKCGSMKAYWTHPDSDSEQFASNVAFVISAITFFTNLFLNCFILSCPELRKIVSWRVSSLSRDIVLKLSEGEHLHGGHRHERHDLLRLLHEHPDLAARGHWQ